AQRARNGAIHPFAGDGIGARNDIEVATGFDRRGDLRSHVVGGCEFLIVQMPAFFRQDLILEVHRRRSGILEAAHHVHRIEHLAVSGIAVDQDGEASGTADLPNEKTDVLDGDNAEVRQPHGGAHARAGKVQGLEPGCSRLQRGQTIVCAGHLQDLGAAKQGAKPLTRARARRLTPGQIHHGGGYAACVRCAPVNAGATSRMKRSISSLTWLCGLSPTLKYRITSSKPAASTFLTVSAMRLELPRRTEFSVRSSGFTLRSRSTMSMKYR